VSGARLSRTSRVSQEANIIDYDNTVSENYKWRSALSEAVDLRGVHGDETSL
jgi:hypothetical protein